MYTFICAKTSNQISSGRKMRCSCLAHASTAPLTNPSDEGNTFLPSRSSNDDASSEAVFSASSGQLRENRSEADVAIPDALKGNGSTRWTWMVIEAVARPASHSALSIFAVRITTSSLFNILFCVCRGAIKDRCGYANRGLMQDYGPPD